MKEGASMKAIAKSWQPAPKPAPSEPSSLGYTKPQATQALAADNGSPRVNQDEEGAGASLVEHHSPEGL